jgi:hypothetical protein
MWLFMKTHKIEWKEHPNYPGYKISNTGIVLKKDGTGPRKYTLTRNGYFFTTFYGVNRRHNRFAHRLIAETFLEKPKSDEPLWVNHKNGIKTDNDISNLEWVTRSQNQIHSRKILGNRCAIGEKSGSVKLTEAQVLEIREAFKNYKRGDYTRLAKKYGVCVANIMAIKDNRSWNYLPPTVEVIKPPRAPRKKYAYARKGRAKGASNGNSKLVEAQVYRIREMFEEGEKSLQEIATLFGVSKSLIKQIKSNIIWQHTNYLGGNNGNKHT